MLKNYRERVRTDAKTRYVFAERLFTVIFLSSIIATIPIVFLFSNLANIVVYPINVLFFTYPLVASIIYLGNTFVYLFSWNYSYPLCLVLLGVGALFFYIAHKTCDKLVEKIEIETIYRFVEGE